MNGAIILISIICIASLVATVIALKSKQKDVALKSCPQQMAQLKSK